MFEIERVRDRERKIGYSLHKGTETLVRHRERFEIEGVRDREIQLYTKIDSRENLIPLGSRSVLLVGQRMEMALSEQRRLFMLSI